MSTLAEQPRRIGAFGLALLLCSPAQHAAAGALERAMVGKSAVVDLTQSPREVWPSPGEHDPAGRDIAEGGKETDAVSRSVPAVELGTLLELAVSPGRGAASVAKIPARDLLVHAVMVDVAASVAQGIDYRVTVEDLQAWERKNGRIPRRSAVLLHTGWSRRWSDPARYLNLDAQGIPHVPGFSVEALDFLIKQRDVRGVGLDASAPEVRWAGGGEEDRMRARAGRWQLLNLTNLDRLPTKGAKLVIAPLRIDAGTAPARVIAILP